jgi:hypothetical protein
MGMCSGVEVGVVQGGATRMLLEVLLLCIASTTKSFLFENVTNSYYFCAMVSPVPTNFH